MEEIHEARYGDRGRSSHALSGSASVLESPPVHPPGSSLNLVFLGFMEVPFYRHG